MSLRFIRKVIFILLVCSHTIGVAAEQKFINITIQGVSCPFCVNMLTKKLSELPNVEEVRMSVDNERLLIVIAPDKNADFPAINNTLQQSGFKSLSTVETSEKAAPSQTKIESSPHVTVGNQPCNTCHK